MKHAVIIGAGWVGRGLIGQLFCEAGFEVTFVDIVPELVDALARDGSYPHHTVSNEGVLRARVGPVTAINAADTDAVIAALVEADLAATAVGARVLPTIVPTLASALEQRIMEGRPPLNLLLCENLHDAASVTRALVTEALPGLPPEMIDANLGLLETCVGRMIPTPDAAPDEPTLITAEPFKELPYDATAVRGPDLDVPGLTSDPHVRFAFYVEEKLYVHNMGHTLTAYLGEREGVATIAEAIAIPTIALLVRAAMQESAQALSCAYDRPLGPLFDHVDDLNDRFGNRALGDTTERVGRDPIRKMAPGDRFLGAYATAIDQGSPTPGLSLAVAAGADALHRHERWSASHIWTQLATGLRSHPLSTAQRELLDAQITGFAEGRDLAWQVELLDAAAHQDATSTTHERRRR